MATKKDNVKANKKIPKEKTNKKVKVQKLNDKYISEESREVRRFIIILMSIIIFVLVIYGLSRVFIDDKKNTEDNSSVAGEIDYDKVSIGTMLNRNIDEYYVIIYDAKDKNAIKYSAIINKYMKNSTSKKVFFCDLGNKLNSDYRAKEDEQSNPNAKTISELSLKELTLVKVNNGKIVKYIENLDTIKSELGL